MDHTNNNNGPEESDLRPPPYSPAMYQDGFYTGTTYQVGKGNISVVSPPGPYDNLGYTEDPPPPAYGGYNQYTQAPPPYPEPQVFCDFSDKTIRKGFIKKVYLTLMTQLLFTVGIICAFIYWDRLNMWVRQNCAFTYSMIGVGCALLLILSIFGQLRRRAPYNYLALSLFTITEGVMLGSVTVYYHAEAVMWAVGATAFVTLGITLFTSQSKLDFTPAAASLWTLGWSLFGLCILCAAIQRQYLYIFCACLGSLVFSLFLVFDTMLILGGKHRRFEISPEEYVFAALTLYVDITSLFLIIMRFVNLCFGR
ncbi:Protein lifeguard 1 [Oryzias melastigma]|uniref:Protein lifeguard 1 n=1 Tax=Oryzias melastigma TaxID=30732 RepID=A0A3B3DMF8_ORYME|nr:protein lifeguard 1 [Oryzias melastigma]KAF6714869.1 Protein lifeguard 1 [Oryzias melastigma]